MSAMNTVDDIFNALGGNAAVARGIGAKPSAISEMRRRSSIPVGYWPALTALATAHGVVLSNDDLVAIHTVRAA